MKAAHLLAVLLVVLSFAPIAEAQDVNRKSFSFTPPKGWAPHPQTEQGLKNAQDPKEKLHGDPEIKDFILFQKENKKRMFFVVMVMSKENLDPEGYIQDLIQEAAGDGVQLQRFTRWGTQTGKGVYGRFRDPDLGQEIVVRGIGFTVGSLFYVIQECYLAVEEIEAEADIAKIRNSFQTH